MPSETRSKYKTVKRTFTENDDAFEFLKELGLTKPDLFAEIEDMKKIGCWGEKVVFNALRKEYIHKNNDLTETDSGFKLIDPNGNEIEIVWLNMKHDVGKGYDLLKRENRTVVEYLEVKTKLGSHEELIKITGKQWESARTLYDRGEGEKYSIYVVSNAGQQTAKITKLNDPIRLWKEGKLYAHPVNFKL